MVNVPKHSWNLHHTTFIIFIDHGQVNWVGESQFYWHAEPWDYLLTHCVPMTSISFLIETIERYQLRCKYLKNKKILVRFCLHFWNLTEISNVWKKKINPHSFFIFEITDSENVVRSMPKNSRLRRLFNKTPGKRAQALLKSASHHLYHIHWSPPSPLSWKKSLLLTSKILGLLVNTFAANEKYPVLNRDHLTIANQIQISQKKKDSLSIFCSIFEI